MALYTFARRADRTLWAWGANNDGVLGMGSTGGRVLTPTQVGTSSDWLSLAGGNNVTDRSHFCAIRADRSLWCWGWNGSGCLGVGDAASRNVPTRVGVTNDWAQVSVGDLHTCARKLDGTLWCWGNNSQNELGTGGGSTNVPVRVGTSVEWAWIAAGAADTCGIMTDGSLWCWGRDNEGQLPFPERGLTTPTRVGTETRWSRVWVARGGLALKTDGTLWTWGFYPATAMGRAPQEVVSAATDWAAGNIGFSRSCGVKRDGTLWCWDGLAGAPSRQGIGSDFAQVSTPIHACARTATGALYCGGSNGNGELGLGDTVPRTTQTRLCP